MNAPADTKTSSVYLIWSPGSHRRERFFLFRGEEIYEGHIDNDKNSKCVTIAQTLIVVKIRSHEQDSSDHYQRIKYCFLSPYKAGENHHRVSCS